MSVIPPVVIRTFPALATEGAVVALEKTLFTLYGTHVARENEVVFTPEYASLLESGKRTHYFRFRPDAIRIPGFAHGVRNILPAYAGDKTKRIGNVRVSNLAIGYVNEWTTTHSAILGAGWQNKEAMLADLSKAYGHDFHSRNMLCAWQVWLQ